MIGSLLYSHSNLNGFILRKKSKKYGTDNLIEGNLKENSKVVIIEDVVTTGNSIKSVINEIERNDHKIVKIISVFDRNEGGRELLKDYNYSPLASIEDLL